MISLESLYRTYGYDPALQAHSEQPSLRRNSFSSDIPLTCQQMYEEFPYRNVFGRGKIENFQANPGEDVYNSTARFRAKFKGREGTFVIGRAELTTSEQSQSRFYERGSKRWEEVRNAPRFDNMQDPFITRVGKVLLIGGVKTGIHPDRPGQMSYWTEVYMGEDLDDFREAEPFLVTPSQIKDLRFVALEDNRVGLFPRFQCEVRAN